jgi:hypothetical protein
MAPITAVDKTPKRKKIEQAGYTILPMSAIRGMLAARPLFRAKLSPSHFS